jgi:hypothetical protein
MAEVVDGITNPLARHGLAVLLTQQDRDESRLPVVAMDDVGTLADLEHEFGRRLGKEREPLRVIPVSVEAVPAEEVGRRMRLDEKAFAPAGVAEPHGAVDCFLIPRHP